MQFRLIDPRIAKQRERSRVSRRNHLDGPIDNAAVNRHRGRRFSVPLSGWLRWSTPPVLSLLIAGPLLWAQVAAPPGLDGRPEPKPAADSRFALRGNEQRVREGTELTDVLGYFTITGNRVTFIEAEDGNRFAGLENLNLERISKMISRAPKQMDWEVSGEVTEYRGANFLLVRRAVLKSPTAAPQRGRRRP